MRLAKSVLGIAVVAASVALALGPACTGGTIAGGPSGGAGAGATSSGGGGVGGVPCNAPPDGYCDSQDDCRCTLCKLSALCTPFGCMADNWCYPPLEDSCTCSDCDWDWQCLTLDGSNCVDDGTCEYQSEGCACADCQSMPTCLDNAELCDRGEPDGVCDPDAESCHCTDCLGADECLCGEECDGYTACVCPACWGDWWCEDPPICWDDGICDWEWEACLCDDCTDLPICAGHPGVGGGGGGGGGG